MRSRAAGLALFLVAAGGLGAAGYQVFRLERARAGLEESRRAFDALSAAVLVNLSDLRGSQQAYLAAGQSPQEWMERSTALVRTLDDALNQLKGLALAQESAGDLGSAARSLDNFANLDERVRDHTRDGQLLMASDLIFGDGAELSRAVARHLETAQARERRARDAGAAAVRRQQAIVLGAAAGVLLAVNVLLVSRRPRAAGPSESPLSDTPEAASAAQPEAMALPPASVGPAPPGPSSPSVERPAPPAAPDLAIAATLCTDLARASDSTELPLLLGRAAGLLDASGIVIWLADASGRELAPVLSHGYSAADMARMPALARAADNATAAAYRNGRLAVVPGRGAGKGALIAPLLGPAGCAGVMAVELADGREARQEVQSLAGIVAAQLVTLVGGAQPHAPAAGPEAIAAGQQ